ncbi:MAG: AMP-binding protein, partial [Planctomycetes bacterium]|nr:AMP-binding protein [Planctomycetota bacterium]
IRKWAQEKPGAPALVHEGREISYEELDRASNRAANGLARLGIGPGDRVAIMLPNVPEFAFVFFGVLKLGAVAVPFNTMYKGGEAAHILKDSGAKAVVALSGFAPLIHEVLPLAPDLKHVILTGERNVTFADPGSTAFVQFVLDARSEPDLDALYRKTGEALAGALRALGAASARYVHRGGLRAGSGRKIGGFVVLEAEGSYAVNAQLFAGRFDPDRFMEVLSVSPEVRDKVLEPLTSVEEEAGRRPSWDEVRRAATEALEKGFDAALAECRMGRDEAFGYEKLRSQALKR